MKYDINLDIATGPNFRTKIWNNKKKNWSEIATMLTTQNKTSETYKEFLAATKEIQGNIKDVGGYVGGFLKGGKRSPKNVTHRQLITLDIDFAHLDLWDDFTMLFDNAAVLHGTHKHSDKTPRYRLVMPLSRKVTPDEYVAISRKIAGLIGIDLFDNTTFETNRLMFWPSNSRDTEYYSELQDGPILDADKILDSYEDWTDIPQWPTAESKLRDAYNIADKQQDPLEKSGSIGAFCRTHSISDAIDQFLSKEYVRADGDRYTFIGGSTSGGLIIYDDKFAFSHHSTDPASGLLCNAFDLVRIHKFGHLNPKESFAKMSEFAVKSEDVKMVIASEKMESAKLEFGDGIEEDIDIDWMVGLQTTKAGDYKPSAHNLKLVFENDVWLKNAFGHNTFNSKDYIMKPVPWDKKVKENRALQDSDFRLIHPYIEIAYGIVSRTKIDDAVTDQFKKNTFHPVKDYLGSLEWDGVERIDTLLIDYFGVTDNPYTRAAIRKTLVGAVARVHKPGCKFDLVLTLVGKQGTYKSQFVDKLGRQWYSDTFITVQGKEGMEQIQGVWIMEMAELAGLKKAEVEAIKHFLSKKEDEFRKAYGRVNQEYKRQCIFIGTTNTRDFLTDPTGNRRFMPVDIDLSKATKNVIKDLDGELDQIWAEAVQMYKDGEPLYLNDEVEAIASEAQNKHSETDDRKGIIENFLEKKLPEDWDEKDIVERRLYYSDPITGGSVERTHTCAMEIMVELFGEQQSKVSKYTTKTINDLMRNVEGWEYVTSTRRFMHYGKQRHFRKIDTLA